MANVAELIVWAGAANTDPALMRGELVAHGALNNAALPAAAFTYQNAGGIFPFKYVGQGWHAFNIDIPENFQGLLRFFYNNALLRSMMSVNPVDSQNSDIRSSAIKIVVDSIATAVAAGAGLYHLSLSLRDGYGFAVAGLWVSIRDSLGVTRIVSAVTDSQGKITFNLNAGTYQIEFATMPLYSPHAPLVQVVAGDVAITVNDFARRSPSAPPVEGLCVIYGTIRKGGLPIANAVVVAKPAKPPFYTDDVLESAEKRSTITDSDGYWELFLAREDFIQSPGKKYRFQVPEMDITGIDMSVPAQDSYSFATLLKENILE